MKKVLFLSFVLSSCRSIAQNPDSTKLQFKGGYARFDHEINRYLFKHHGYLDDQPFKMYNRYFAAIFAVDKDGKLKSDITVLFLSDSLCVEDSVATPVIVAALRQTEGQWINLTGHEMQLVLPVYYNTYVEDGPSDPYRLLRSLVMKISSYRNGQPSTLIHCRPIIVYAYPPMYKRSIQSP